MSRATKIIIAFSVVSTLFFGAVLLAVQPIPLPTSENTVLVQGFIKSVATDEETQDVIFEIEGYGDTYYINRGLELGIEANQLKHLVDAEVVLYYVQSSNLLEVIAHKHHVSRIEFQGDVLFDEVEEVLSADLATNGGIEAPW